MGGSGDRYYYSSTPFESAVMYANEKSGSTVILDLMLSYGADVNYKHKGGSLTPLEYVLRYGDGKYRYKIAEWLLKNKANPNVVGDDGLTPLHKAVSLKHTELVSVLLKHGASVNATDNNGDTPLYFAEQNRSTKIIALLKKHGATSNE